MLCQILLGSTLPTVVEDLNINGAGSPPSINGGGAVRVFNLGGVSVNISNLGIAGGLATTGGGIEMAGTTLTVTNVNFSNNHGSLEGGAMLLDFGEARLTNVTLSGNSAGRSGAGIFITGTTTVLNLNNVTISANTVDTDP